MTFHDDEHRINNTGWMRNVNEIEEWNEKQNQRGDAECFSILHFLDQKWSNVLNLCLQKLRGLCKYLANAHNSNSHVCGLHCLTFVYENKAGKSMQWGESSFRNVSKKSSVLSHIEYGEVSLQIEFATLPPKNHNLFVKEEQKGNWNNKENAVTG